MKLMIIIMSLIVKLKLYKIDQDTKSDDNVIKSITAVYTYKNKI